MASDAELLQQWRDGDGRAGSALFERYYEPVERFFLNKLPGDIRDLVQDTFFALVKGRDAVKDPDKVREYLFSAAYHVLCSHLREKYRDAERVEPDLTISSIQDLSPGPVTGLGRRDEQRLLLESLRRIPVTDQTLLELYYWEDLTTEQIGAILDIPRGTVKSRLYRARERLERELQRVATSVEVLASTLSDLEAWARGCRDALGREAADEAAGAREQADE